MKLRFSQVPMVVTSVILLLGMLLFYWLHSGHTSRHLEQQSNDAVTRYLLEQLPTLQNAMMQHNLAFLQDWVALKAERDDVEQVLIFNHDYKIIAASQIALEQEFLAQHDIALMRQVQALTDVRQGQLYFVDQAVPQHIGVLMALPDFGRADANPRHAFLYLLIDSSATYRLVNEILLSDFVLYVSSLLLCALVIFLLTRQSLHRRLHNLTATIRSYASGDSNARVHVSYNSEFSALEGLLNATFDALEQQKLISQREQLFTSQVVDSTTDGIISIDTSGKIIMINDRAVTMFGYAQKADLLLQDLQILVPTTFRAAHGSHLFQTNKESYRHGVINQLRHIEGLKRSGDTFPIEITIAENMRGQQRIYTAFVKDNSEQFAYRRSIEKLAYYDELTGLLNLTGFKRQLGQDNSNGQLLLVNIDSIRTVNDSLGFAAGDELIKACASLLAQLPLHQSIVCRLSGGEFLLRCTDSPLVLRQQLPAFLSQEIAFDRRRYQLSYCCSFVSFMPMDDLDDKHRQLELAMRQAKQKGRASLIEVDVQWTEQIQRNALLSHQLEEAIRQNELFFVFQPKFNAQTCQPASAEALIRWINRGQFVSPAMFIPLAEQSHLMPALDRLVIDRACRTIRQWLDRGLTVLPISINLSAKYLCEEKTIATIFEKVGEFDIPPHLLEIEVTEYSFINEFELTTANMLRLQKAGISIAIDDYGTGHSNLEAVLSLPVQHLKIDQSFIRVGMSSDKGRAILENILQLAQSLHIITTAEGVETQEQLDYLATAGCDYIQGYLLSKPLPQAEFEHLLGQPR